MARIVSLAVLMTLIVILGTTFFRVVAPFMLPLFIAGITAVICQPLFRYFLKRTGNRVRLAAGATTFTIMASLMIPLITATVLASLQLYTFSATIQSSDELRLKTKGAYQKGIAYVARLIETANQFLPHDRRSVNANPLEQNYPPPTDISLQPTEPVPDAQAPDLPPAGAIPPDDPASPPEPKLVDLPDDGRQEGRILQTSIVDLEAQLRLRVREVLNDLGDRSLGRAAGTTLGVLALTAGVAVRAVIGIAMCAIALYFFLADGTTLMRAAEKMIPVHADYQRELLLQFSKVVRSVVLATFLAALGQGLATTLALWFLGFDHLLLLFVLACFAALIPLAGTWLVWMPCAIILFAGGQHTAAIMLILYGILFVGFLDNIIRTYVLNSDTKLHPLLAFISVLGGIQAMGLWGVFIGPIVASCLHALIKIFNHELVELSRDRSARVPALDAMGDASQASVAAPAAVAPALPVPPVAPTPPVAPPSQPRAQQSSGQKRRKKR